MVIFSFKFEKEVSHYSAVCEPQIALATHNHRFLHLIISDKHIISSLITGKDDSRQLTEKLLRRVKTNNLKPKITKKEFSGNKN
jgi:methyltransferase-like protein